MPTLQESINRMQAALDGDTEYFPALQELHNAVLSELKTTL